MKIGNMSSSDFWEEVFSYGFLERPECLRIISEDASCDVDANLSQDFTIRNYVQNTDGGSFKLDLEDVYRYSH
ncbi:hypothetical protein J4481_00665 [Candidatus Pacearchaeota archaeon]|nr:hypothetical protein [Candidatus Pacearchaeota archaeon]